MVNKLIYATLCALKIYRQNQSEKQMEMEMQIIFPRIENWLLKFNET